MEISDNIDSLTFVTSFLKCIKGSADVGRRKMFKNTSSNDIDTEKDVLIDIISRLDFSNTYKTKVFRKKDGYIITGRYSDLQSVSCYTFWVRPLEA